MAGVARLGDPVEGGLHCHGHEHGPRPTPGTIVSGSARVFVEGRSLARAGDAGYSPVCCAGVGAIVLQASQGRVFADGLPVVGLSSPSTHCGIAPGQVAGASTKVFIP